MARDNTGATGVTNHLGEVFVGNDTSETHSGLIVTDGALIPTALGANPLATIAALAERAVDEYAKTNRLRISREDNGILNLFGEPAHLPRRPSKEGRAFELAEAEAELHSVQEASSVIGKADAIKAGGFGFTEVMSGFIHNDPELKEDKLSTYQLAYRTAKGLCESARFFLSVQAFNTKTLVSDPEHRGMLTGTFVCPTIEGSPFMVQRGEFNLFVVDHKAPGTRNLTYDFDMKGINGRVLHFHGYKVVNSAVALDPVQFWRSTSTLYVTIGERSPIDGRAPLDEEDQWRLHKPIARGIMHISPKDLLSQALTLAPTGSSLLKKVISAASFMTYFTRTSLSLFLAPFTPLQYPTQSYHYYVNDTPPTQSYTIVASDDVRTKMHMWEPDPSAVATDAAGRPVPIKNLFMIPGAAVDHQIFALPTIPYNAVNYFTRAGYRVFVTVHRIGQLMVAENSWTTYDARLDMQACLKHIRECYGTDKIYTIAHCMGSVAFSCGLLDGTIPASWILGVSCSQVFMNPIWNTLNMIKATAGPIPMNRLYGLLAGSWFNCSTARDDSLVQRCINQALRLYPDERREICNNASCHRTTLVFGRCWNHRNLNEATHRQIDRFFGGVNMTLLHLLMLMGSQGHVMSNAPLCEVLTTPGNVQRLRGIPFLLFVGGDNAVLSPMATEKTYEILCDTLGSVSGAGQEGVAYRRRVVPGYGHLDCWMGRNAWKDVYPFVRQEVDRVVRGEAYEFREPDDRFKRMVETGELLF